MNIRKYAVVERPIGASDRRVISRHLTANGARRARRQLAAHFAGTAFGSSVIWSVTRSA